MTDADLPFDGLINFRDFGGSPTESGSRVRQGFLFRCGQLADIPAAALESMLRLDFEVIIDLRDLKERRAAPSPWPATYAGRVLAHEGAALERAPHVVALMTAGGLGPEAIVRSYLGLYANLPFDPSYRLLFARAVQAVADTSGRTLIHCAAGKDRTGILSALILSSLGVPREAILADYLRSSRNAGLVAMRSKVATWSRKRHGYELTEETIDTLLDVRAEYLQAALDRIERECGSVAGYLTDCGLSAAVTERLRARLLEA